MSLFSYPSVKLNHQIFITNIKIDKLVLGCESPQDIDMIACPCGFYDWGNPLKIIEKLWFSQCAYF